MSSKAEDLTINYEEDGIQVVKELDKIILSKGGPWATIIFLHQDWDARKKEYGPAKFTIRRYQKRNDEYKVRSKFTISNRDQAGKIISAMQTWMQSPLMASGATGPADESDEQG